MLISNKLNKSFKKLPCMTATMQTSYVLSLPPPSSFLLPLSSKCHSKKSKANNEMISENGFLCGCALMILQMS